MFLWHFITPSPDFQSLERYDRVLQKSNSDELGSMFFWQMKRVTGVVATVATAANGDGTGLAATAWIHCAQTRRC